MRIFNESDTCDYLALNSLGISKTAPHFNDGMIFFDRFHINEFGFRALGEALSPQIKFQLRH